jgi:ABC-type uncharacterized transport system ATPase component
MAGSVVQQGTCFGLSAEIQGKVRPEERSQMVWRFAQDNLARVAAPMVVVDNIESLKDRPDWCLLRSLRRGNSKY